MRDIACNLIGDTDPCGPVAASADAFGGTETGDATLSCETNQPMARPLLPGRQLAEQWGEVSPDRRGDADALSKSQDPDRACVQILQLCGSAFLDQLPILLLYTDQVCMMSGQHVLCSCWYACARELCLRC